MRSFVIAVLALTFIGAAQAAPEEPAKGGVAVSSVKTDKPKRSFESWLKDLKKRVARARARPNQLVAVAAVRGAEQKDIAPKLYWKGKRSEGPVATAELEDFEKAIDSALNGEPEASSKLQAFLSSYPKSSLSTDAKTALERLSANQ